MYKKYAIYKNASDDGINLNCPSFLQTQTLQTCRQRDVPGFSSIS